MSRLKLFSILLAFVAFISSCSTDDDSYYESMIVDAYTKNTKNDQGDAIYSKLFIVRSNFEVKTAKVIDAQEGSNYEKDLDKFWAGVNNVRFADQLSNYSTTAPTKSKFNFKVFYNDEKYLLAADSIKANFLAPINITTKEYDSSSNTITTAWDELTGADAYIVKVSKELFGEPLFYSDYIKDNSLTINLNKTGWLIKDQMVKGEKYIVEIMGLDFNTINATYLDTSDVICKSFDTFEITW